MNIKINIEEDEDLRNFIKNAIEGQVRAINREDVLSSLKEEVAKKITKDRILEIAESQLRTGMIDVVLKAGVIQKWNTDWIKPYIEKVLGQYIATAINNMNLTAIVNKSVEKQIDAEVLKLLKKNLKS